jgi:lysyl-tRNA synthetase class 2
MTRRGSVPGGFLETKDESQQPVEQLIANRRAKLDALREMGQNPYPRRFRVELSVSEARSRYEGLRVEELEADPPMVRLGGRLRAIRGHGKVSFADLSDGAGQIQLYLKKNDLDDSSWQVFRQLDLGDFLGVEGTVFRTRAGELSVAVKEITVLAKALRPLPEKYHGLADREARARQRYLDLLSNPESREIFETRSKVVSSIRRRPEGAGFIEVETPMMQPIPGGATARP